MYRKWFITDFCQPIYVEWLSEAVAKGRIIAPGFFADPIIKDAYCSAEWNVPSLTHEGCTLNLSEGAVITRCALRDAILCGKFSSWGKHDKSAQIL